MLPSSVQPSSSDGGLTTSAQFSSVGEVGQVAHQAGLDQLLGLAAVVELGGPHRVAAGDAADHDRPRGVARAGDGAVDPFVAGGVEGLGELGDRRRLAARRPPVRDLEVRGVARRPAAAPRTPRGPRPASGSVIGNLPGSASLQVNATKGGPRRQSPISRRRGAVGSGRARRDARRPKESRFRRLLTSLAGKAPARRGQRRGSGERPGAPVQAQQVPATFQLAPATGSG